MPRSVAPNTQQMAFRKGIEQAIRAHGAALDATEILAVLAHCLGQVIALQDQRRYTPDQVMQVVQANIEQGNKEVVDNLLATKGTA